MANSIPQMSLKQAALNMGSFSPSIYTPQTEDVNILQRSLAQIEARQKEAAQTEASFNEVATKLEELVNPNEQSWVHDYINRMSEGFKQSAQAGDHGAAIRKAIVAGSELLKKPEAMGRIKAQAKFQEEIKTQQARRDKNEISQNTYDWWLSNNGYKYEDIIDEKTGEIIGGSEYIAENRPVNDIDFAAQAVKAYNLIIADKISTQNGGQRASNIPDNKWDTGSPYRHDPFPEAYQDEDGKIRYRVVVGDNQEISTSYQNQRVEQKVSPEEIRARIERLIADTPDGFRQIKQAYDVSNFEYNKMQDKYKKLLDTYVASKTKDPIKEKELNDLNQQIKIRENLLSRNGSPITKFEDYYAKMITESLYASGLANTNLATSHNSSLITENKIPKTSGGYNSQNPIDSQTSDIYVNGETVIQDTKISYLKDVLSYTQSNVNKSFNSPKGK